MEAVEGDRCGRGFALLLGLRRVSGLVAAALLGACLEGAGGMASGFGALAQAASSRAGAANKPAFRVFTFCP